MLSSFAEICARTETLYEENEAYGKVKLSMHHLSPWTNENVTKHAQ